MGHLRTSVFFLDGLLGDYFTYLNIYSIQVVAVKTMILPSNMAGAEKREKMVRLQYKMGIISCKL